MMAADAIETMFHRFGRLAVLDKLIVQMDPVGRKTDQNKSIRNKISPAVRTSGFLTWRLHNRTKHASVANRVWIPNNIMPAASAVSTNSV